MSSVRRLADPGRYVTPTVMSVGHIQRQDLFDDDDDDGDDVNDENAAEIAGTDVNSEDMSTGMDSSTSLTSSSSCCIDKSCCRNVLTMFLLTTVNLLNYMDRFSVAGTSSTVSVLISVTLQSHLSVLRCRVVIDGIPRLLHIQISSFLQVLRKLHHI